MTQGSDARSMHDAGGLAHMLLPALLEACGGRLSRVEWFRAPWQRGGAATARARWDDPGSGTQCTSVFVKLPVGPTEYRWTTAMSAVCENPHAGPERAPLWPRNASRNEPTIATRITPRVLAHGVALGSVDLAWLVTEQLAGPMHPARVSDAQVRAMLHACVGFQSLAHEIDPAPEAARDEGGVSFALPDWAHTLARAKEACKADKFPHLSRWQEVIYWTTKHLPHLINHWQRRPINSWCHGDLHPGNAMFRPGDPTCGEGCEDCVLIDLALVHRGHWMEDALYLERQFWGHEDVLHGVKPLTWLANMRRHAGLPSGGDYGTLANIRRVLAASCVPALREREGNPAYVEAALDVAERLIPQLQSRIV